MKKYLVFIISFLLLFSLIFFAAQLFSGMFLISTHTSDMNAAWNESAGLTQQITLSASGSPFWLVFLTALLSANIAYFISQKLPRLRSNNK